MHRILVLNARYFAHNHKAFCIKIHHIRPLKTSIWGRKRVQNRSKMVLFEVVLYTKSRFWDLKKQRDNNKLER